MAKILIADDCEVMRQSLRTLLTEKEDWFICGEAADGQQAVAMAAQLNPDLIILDLAMPILDGSHAADEILGSNPAIPILLYTLHKTDAIELAAKKAGVRHVVAKTEGTNALLSRAQGLLVPNAISALLLPEIQATVDSTARISDAEPQRQADASRSGAAQSS